MSSSKPHVIIGLSGGVDSAVSALLLKQQGYQVTGLFMQNWESENDDPHCTAEQDLSDARAVADQIGIPLQTVNFAKEYWDRVFQHCLDEFTKGNTPNPDILCNSEIKFKAFLEHALTLGADHIATGHYVRLRHHADGHVELLRGLDQNKDQSYFLYAVSQAALQKSIFPIGEIEKPRVREIAEEAGLINHNKKDSTGICFIGERHFKTFLQEFLLAQPGDMVDENGNVLGRHDGTMFYTIGQRKGLNIGGQKSGNNEAWYVIDKDIKTNQLIVGQGYNHPRLYKPSLQFNQANWINPLDFSQPLRLQAKTRYHQQTLDQPCTATQIDDDTFKVDFDEPQRAITPGQSLVLYKDDVCLGGGIIL